MDTASFFDSVAETWDSAVIVDRAKISHILEVAGIGEGDEVLDVGTGTGVLIPFIAERRCGHIDAVDISGGMLARAMAKHGWRDNVSFIQEDVESGRFSGRYDCVMLYCVYPHFEHPLETVGRLTRQNLRPGGRLVIAFPDNREAINRIDSHNDGSVHASVLCDGAALKSHIESLGMNVDYVEDNEEFFIVRIIN